MSFDIVLHYNKLLYALVDPGMLDKRTEAEAFEQTMREVARLKARDEELHELEKAVVDIEKAIGTR